MQRFRVVMRSAQKRLSAGIRNKTAQDRHSLTDLLFRAVGKIQAKRVFVPSVGIKMGSRYKGDLLADGKIQKRLRVDLIR